MEQGISAGYKQTEVGVIPEDWRVAGVGSLDAFVTSGSRGWAAFYSNRGALFVRITNLSRERIHLDLADSKFVRLPAGVTEGSRTQLRACDMLISITADIGIVGYVGANVPRPAYINQHIALVRFDPLRVCARFVAYFLASEIPQRVFRSITDIGAKAGLNLLTVRKIQTALPPLDEQRAIADALGDVDALLDAQDRLIAKQRDLKQAAMQQLLTGRTRLPGFTGEWQMKRLGDLCQLSMGRTPPRADPKSWGGRHVWLSIADLVGKIVTTSKERVSDKAASTMTAVAAGTLLMSFKLTIGRLCFAGCDLYTNEAICALNGLQDSADYLYYALARTDFSLYGKQAVKGYTLNKDSLALVEVPMPSVPEQTAIAAVLSDLDAEIAALEARRAKTRNLKQAMLQELLTGRTRLV